MSMLEVIDSTRCIVVAFWRWGGVGGRWKKMSGWEDAMMQISWGQREEVEHVSRQEMKGELIVRQLEGEQFSRSTDRSIHLCENGPWRLRNEKNTIGENRMEQGR